MNNVFKLRTMALAKEPSFMVKDSTPGAFDSLFLAQDITFSPRVETFVFQPLRGEYGEYSGVKQHTRSRNTLTFRVPLYGFLPNGSSYTQPLDSQLVDLLEHCLGGGHKISSVPILGFDSGLAPNQTQQHIVSAATSEVSSIIGDVPNNGIFQGRSIVRSVLSGFHIGYLDGQWLNDSGVPVNVDGSSAQYASNTAYSTNVAKFPFTYSFELAGDDTNDAYVLTGCAGTCRITGTVSDLVWADFTFNVASWQKTTRDQLDHTGGVDALTPYDHPHGNPIPFLGSQVSYHERSDQDTVVTSKLIEAVSFELDLGVSIDAMSALGQPEGIGFWYKSAFRPRLQINAYWDDSLDDLFFSPEKENAVYVQIGSSPGSTVVVYAKHLILENVPQISDQEGLKTKTLAGNIGAATIDDGVNSSGGKNEQHNSILKIAFL